MNSGHFPIFRTFSEEAPLIVAGWHDGSQTNISYEHSHDSLVGFHEDIHDKIMRQCPDGQILGLLLWAQRLGSLDPQLLPQYNKLIGVMFESSEFAQEVSATYLSIKQHSVEQHESQFSRYPRNYQNYYNELASAIDHKFFSSYLQYLLAWNIATIAFSSSFLYRFLAMLPHLPNGLELDEQPNHRCSVLIDKVKRATCNDILVNLQLTTENIASVLGTKPWDIQDERGWEKASGNAVRQIELALSNQIRPWLCNITGLTELNYTNDLSATFENFGESLGIKIMHTPAYRTPEQEQHNIIVEARSAAQSVIYNPARPPIITDEDMVFARLQPDYRIAIGCAESTRENLDLVAWSPGSTGEQGVYAKIDDHTVHRVFHGFKESTEYPVVDAIVLGLHSRSDIREWYIRLANYILPGPPNQILRQIGLYQFDLFWYLHGDYLTWIESLQKPLYFSKIGIKSNFFEYGGGVLRVLKRPGSNELFIRLFNAMAANKLHQYENALQAQGQLIDMGDPMESHGQSIQAAYNLVSLMWETL